MSFSMTVPSGAHVGTISKSVRSATSSRKAMYGSSNSRFSTFCLGDTKLNVSLVQVTSAFSQPLADAKLTNRHMMAAATAMLPMIRRGDFFQETELT